MGVSQSASVSKVSKSTRSVSKSASRTGMGSVSKSSVAPVISKTGSKLTSKFSVTNAGRSMTKRSVSKSGVSKTGVFKSRSALKAGNSKTQLSPKTYVPRSKTSSRATSKASVSRSYVSKMKSPSRLSAVTEEKSTRSNRTIAIEDLSATKLFKVANKAQDKGVAAMKADFEARLRLVKVRAEVAEARADREFSRAESTQHQLDVALVRAIKAEIRASELSEIPVKEVLQFIIKNSNTAQKKMGEEVRPEN